MHKLWYVATLVVAVVGHAQMAVGSPKFLGNITTAGNVRADYLQFWNQITAENECKWGSVEGTRDQYNWTGCDRVYNFAKQNGIPTKFHTLVWGSQYPGHNPNDLTAGWLMQLSQADQLIEITEWFDEAQKRYPDLDMIDVVNEAVPGHAPAPFKNALGGDGATGYDWIITAFRMARDRWPNAILIYNDYNALTWQRAEYIDLLNKIKGSGYVDAAGLQSHGLEGLSAATLRTYLEEIHTKVGLPIVVSEYDVNIQDDTAQKNKLEEQLPVFWEADYVAGVTMWGYVLGSTWIDYSGLIRSDGSERPSMTWLKSYIASHKNVTSPIDWTSLGGPKFTTPAAITLEEGITAVTTLATSATGVVFSISGGTDAAKFALNGAALSFVQAPSHASPTDANTDNVYEISVKATKGTATSTLNLKVTIAEPKAPYGGTPHALPGRIEAEKYDLGGEGKGYHEADAQGNQGNANLRGSDQVDIENTGDATGEYNIGYTLQGEWLAYTVNIGTAGSYKIDLRLATNGDAKSMHVELDGVNISDAIAVPNTADWQTWATATVNSVDLPAGNHELRVVFDADYINLNWIEITSEGPVHTKPMLSEDIPRLQNMVSNADFVIQAKGTFSYRIVSQQGATLESGVRSGRAQVGQNLIPGVYILAIRDAKGAHFVHRILKQ